MRETFSIRGDSTWEPLLLSHFEDPKDARWHTSIIRIDVRRTGINAKVSHRKMVCASGRKQGSLHNSPTAHRGKVVMGGRLSTACLIVWPARR
jgi:hypothetical protein